MRFQNFKTVLLPILALAFSALTFQFCKTDPKSGGQNSGAPLTDTKTVRVRIEADVTSLHTLFTNAYGRNISGRFNLPLGDLDPVSLELKPLIIKALPTMRQVTEGPNKGCVAYDFEIYDEAVWDNGSPVTGNDVAFTVKMIMNPLMNTGRWLPYFELMKDIEVDAANPKKFTCYLTKYYILGLETLCQFPIFPAYIHDPKNLMPKFPVADFFDKKKSAAFAQNADIKAFADEAQLPKYGTDPQLLSGCGAYSVEVLKPGEGVVLVRKKNWWGDKITDNPLLKAYPEKLVYRPVKDEAAATTMLQNGELDVAMTFSVGKWLELKNGPLAQNYVFGTTFPTLYNYVLLNHRNQKLADKRVRQALAHSMDYDYLINEIQKGMAKRTIGPVNPSKPYYNKEVVPYDYNIAKAKELLASAGWKDGNGNGIVEKKFGDQVVELNINMMATTSSETTRLFAESFKETAKKAGINIEIVPVDLNKLVEENRSGKFEASMNAVATFPGADDFHQRLHSKSIPPVSENFGAFVNKKADELLDAIRTEPDMAKRTELYKQVQALIHEELPAIYFTAPEQRFIVSKRFDAVMTANRPGHYEWLFRPANLN